MKTLYKGMIYHALFVFAVIFLRSIIYDLIPAYALESYSSTTVSAFIGDYQATIFGYTSPSARVEINSPGVFAVTQSDPTGYYEFSDLILPKNNSDLCLRSLDDLSRSSNPVCIPPPPATNYNTSIGPIILPPTISLDADMIVAHQDVSASGTSIPNSTVTVRFFQKDDIAPLLPQPVSAFSLPQLEVATDANGNYSLNIPTSYSTSYRLLTAVLYQGQSSPLSNTLSFSLPSLWYYFWLENSFLIISLLIFIPTLTFFFWLIRFARQPASLQFLPTPISSTVCLLADR